MGIISGVVNIAHERIGGHRDMHAAFRGDAVRRKGSIPQSSETENLAIGEMNEEGLLLAVSCQVPFIESRGNLNAALPALPRPSIGRCGLDRLNARIDG